MRIAFEPEDLLKELPGVALADETRRLQIETIALATATARVGAEAEARRLAAKYGADATQTRAARRRAELIDAEQRAVNADRARQRVGTLETSPDVFSIYGRVLNASGDALQKLTVVAVDTTGVELAKTKTREEGLFQLRVPIATKKNARKTDAEAPDNVPIVRLRITNPQGEVLSFNDEEFDAVGDTVAYREIIVMMRDEGEPKAKRARKKPRRSGR